MPLSSKQAIELSKIFIDSLNIRQRIVNDSIIHLYPDCSSLIEYFAEDNSYYLKDCSTFVIKQHFVRNRSFSDYINKLVSEEKEISDLLKRIQVDYIVKYYSDFNCCCAQEYTPARCSSHDERSKQ